MSLRDELIAAMQAEAALATKVREVSVEGYPTVYVRELTVAEVDEDQATDETKSTRIARGAARVICDKDGKRLFDPNSVADVKLLSSQRWSKLSAIIADPKEKAKDAGK